MSFRDRIGAAWDVPSEKATIAGVEVELRSMSVADKGRLVKEGATNGLVDIEKWNPLIVLLCAYDPETGERAFADDDFEWLQQRPADLIAELAGKCSNISALSSEKVVAEAGKGS